MSWRMRSWRLPDFGLTALPAGCGLSGDDAASWVVLWHGSAVSWTKSPLSCAPASAADATKGAELRHHSFTFPGDEAVIVARPLPALGAIVAVRSGGCCSVMTCDESRAPSVSVPVELGAEFRVVDVWSFGDGILGLSSDARLKSVTFGSEGPKSISTLKTGSEPPHFSEIAMASFATVPCSRPEEVEAWVVTSGRIDNRSPVFARIWEVRQDFGGFIDVPLLSARVDDSQTADSVAVDPVVSIGIIPSARRICLLHASGDITVVGKATDKTDVPSVAAAVSGWSVCFRLPAFRVAGLRLCASVGLDPVVLDSESSEVEAASNAAVFSRSCVLHVWKEGTVALLFPPAVGPQGGMLSMPELVTLDLSLPEPCLASTTAYRAIDFPRATSSGSDNAESNSNETRVVTCGSAGGELIFAAVQEEASTGRTIGNVFSAVDRVPQASGHTGNVDGGSVQRFRAIFGISDVTHFVESALCFDPFPTGGIESSGEACAIGCGQVQRLLEAARCRLTYILGNDGATPHGSTASAARGVVATNAASNDGWDFDLDDFDDPTSGHGGKEHGDSLPASEAPKNVASGLAQTLPSEMLQMLRRLLARVELQSSRLQSFKQCKCSLAWASFRETDDGTLLRQACQMAAEQSVMFLEVLFQQQPAAVQPHWESILNALPETTPAKSIRRILPAPVSSKVDTYLKLADSDVGWVTWYTRRAQEIVDRTGMCEHALDLLRHAIHAATSASWPERSAHELPLTANLPVASTSASSSPLELRRLYGAFRLCAEYASYRRVALQDLFLRRVQSGDGGSLGSGNSALFADILALGSFCELEPHRRAQLVFRTSTAATIVSDVCGWLSSVRVDGCFVNLPEDANRETKHGVPSQPSDALVVAATGACVADTEEVIMQSLLGCLSLSGFDPACFQIISEVVQASSPALPSSDRIIQSPLRLLEFILGSVYSSEQRCRAVDIFRSVDLMYACIPKADASVASGSRATRWAELQQQADELEKHICCVELLAQHKIPIALSFADLRAGCTHESMAERSLWNLFRVLGARYRPAIFWRDFKDELFYMHSNAFAAVSMSAVFDMYVRCLAEQTHFEVIATVASDWAKACSPAEVATSLIDLAQELVNSSPALQHPDLEKARRILKCLPHVDGQLAQLAQAETDFIKACELLHDLVRFQPRQENQWMEDLRNINPMNKLSKVTSAMTAHLPSQRGTTGSSRARSAEPEVTPGDFGGEGSPQVRAGGGGAEGFPIDGPVQLRLQMSQPLRVVRDLLEFNPPVMLEPEHLHKFLSLVGLGPSSSCWAEVMAMCGAAQLLNGNRAEASTVTEKLLANGHPAAWKLALALASAEADEGAAEPTLLGVDHGSALLADATKVCPASELPQLLSFFQHGPPHDGMLLSRNSKSVEHAGSVCSVPRGYACDVSQKTSFSLWAMTRLGLDEEVEAEDTSPANAAMSNKWRGLPLWEDTCAQWTDEASRRHWGEVLLPVDRDTGVVMLDSASGLPDSGGLPKPRPRGSSEKISSPVKTAAPAKAPAPRQALDALAAHVTSSPSLQRPAGQTSVASEMRAPRDALHSLVRGAASATEVPASTAPPAASERRDLRHALDGLVSQAAPEPATAAPANTAKHSFFALKAFEGVTGGLRSLMSSAQVAAPEIGRETEDTSPRQPTTHDSSAEKAQRVKNAARRLLQHSHGMDEDTDKESPSTRPDCSVLLSSLESIHEACPGMDLSDHSRHIADEVHSYVDVSTASSLIQSLSGVEALQRHGVCPSSVALEAARKHLRATDSSSCVDDIALLVNWLSPADAAELLQESLLCKSSLSRAKQLQILGHVREASHARPAVEDQLADVVRQAEALSLLRSVFQSVYGESAEFPLRIDANAPAEVACTAWLHEISSSAATAAFEDTAKDVLADLGISPL
eukprot:TRINITY_DN13817_c0_g1_i1.p1 TRINITY_DN13817_c0_g1~~TRINITY_DN13817_c0_g1_i1.p1  ORF type:complete len:1912 (-),score=287.85 TRINITY_DN13817_c0_g1_i1:95-5830(-)